MSADSAFSAALRAFADDLEAASAASLALFDRFEAAVIRQIQERILTRDSLIDLVRVVNEEMDSSMKNHQDELGAVSGMISDINNRLERLYDAVETGRLGLDDISVRIRDLRGRQEQLPVRRIELESLMSDRKVELADMETISGCVADLNILLKEGTLTERRVFIKSFVKEIRVTGDHVVMSYSMPILPEALNVEHEEVRHFRTADMVGGTVRYVEPSS